MLTQGQTRFTESKFSEELTQVQIDLLACNLHVILMVSQLN